MYLRLQSEDDKEVRLKRSYVSIYQDTRCCNPEERNRNIRCRENIKFHTDSYSLF
jgi:hypothetical protein